MQEAAAGSAAYQAMDHAALHRVHRNTYDSNMQAALTAHAVPALAHLHKVAAVQAYTTHVGLLFCRTWRPTTHSGPRAAMLQLHCRLLARLVER